MRAVIRVAYRVRGLVYIAALSILFAGFWVPVGDGVRDVLVLSALAMVLVCLGLTLFGPRWLPDREPVAVAVPVSGRWLGLNSPATKVPSHGVRMYGQSHAIDIVYEPEGGVRPEFGSGSGMLPPSDYPGFGVPVRSMIDGTVVRVSDRHRDHRSRSSWSMYLFLMVESAFRELGGPGFIVGNHVTVRGAAGVFATLAHLQHGSVTVREGDVVRAGQQIGRCGNSGNSTEPHVHAQLADRASLWTAQGIPLAFVGIALDDAAERIDGLPRNGQHMTAPVRI